MKSLLWYLRSTLQFTVILAFLLLIGTCSSPYPIVRQSDPQEGTMRTYMVGNLIGAQRPNEPFRDELYLNAMRLNWRTGEEVYFLVARYNGDSWLQIPSGNSLRLIVDSRVIELSSDGSDGRRSVLRDENDESYHTEQAWFGVEPEQLKRMARARKISVTLRGQNNTLNRDFTRSNLNHLRTFVRRNVR